MAVNIFERYGIKEVANVYFEALVADPLNNVAVGDIVLYLDTLKISTIEQTAENSEARGGWGNPSLIMWDYGKEINITLEDALISLESLRFMLGGAIRASKADTAVTVRRTAEATITVAATAPAKVTDQLTGAEITLPETGVKYINMTQGTRGVVGESAAITGALVGDKVRFFWAESVVTTDAAVEIVISPATFPGVYRVVGDTYIRNENNKDSMFQFTIERAKVLSEITISMEAEGDPSTFEMSLRALRSGSEMMKLTKYDL